MNKKCIRAYLYTLLLGIGLTIPSGCAKDRIAKEDMPDPNIIAPNETPSRDVIPNLLRVKLTEDYAEKLGQQALRANGDGKLRTSIADLTQCLEEIGAKEIRPVFTLEPQFEKRMKREGLHLWYDIVIDDSQASNTRSAKLRSVSDLSGVQIVEEVPRYNRNDEMPTFGLRSFDFNPVRPDDYTLPFNDPYLSKQWHYFNTGAGLKSVKGADLNLFDAWTIETGKPEVIVAVIDGGVYFEHEDLQQNIWVNPNPGTPGSGAPYINDIHGYNFGDDNAEIAFDAHGTHVAGTVAAVNNNGIGVCGVAGGNGSSNSGVRIMVCDAFGKTDKKQNFENAFIYAANHGAVVAQNSWGGAKFLSPSLQSAIDYFIKYAGCDNDGNQLPGSPMKGGIVLFAAGNESSDDIVYPAAYHKVVAVSAMAPNWRKAYYTNRGEWIDIMAPGGDTNFPGGSIYSTSIKKQIDENGNIISVRGTYEFMQGTSMACPHVSGVAALIVSHFGGENFTNEECKRRLLTALRPADINENNPGFEGILGDGYLDAGVALSFGNPQGNDKKIPPKNVSNVSVIEDYTKLTLQFSAASDEDDRTATYYYIYYSDKEPLTTSNYQSAKVRKVFGLKYAVGDEISVVFNDLKLNSTYYFAIVGEDRWGNKSTPVFASATTKLNNPPVIEILNPTNVRITGSEQVDLHIKVTDPDGHALTYKLSGDHTGVQMIDEGKDKLTLRLTARGAVGKHSFTLIATDEFGAFASQEVAFEVYANSAPALVKELPSPIYLPLLPGLSNEATIDLSEYIQDPDGHKVTYLLTSSMSKIVRSKMDGTKLILTPTTKGRTLVQVKALDTEDADMYVSLQVQVVDDDMVYHVYPIPTYDELNIIINGSLPKVDISVVNQEGAKVLSREVVTTSGDAGIANEVELDVRSLSGGIYTLIVKSGDKTYYRKFTKY